MKFDRMSAQWDHDRRHFEAVRQYGKTIHDPEAARKAERTGVLNSLLVVVIVVALTFLALLPSEFENHARKVPAHSTR